MRKKILMVDNDTDLQDLLALILADAGYETLGLHTADVLLKTIRQFKPDLVLLDVMSGSEDGRVTCRKIKTTAGMRSLPVILVSGIHDLSEAMYHPGGPNDVLSKPFDILHLLEKIRVNIG